MPPSPLEQRARTRLGTVLRGKYRLDSVLGVGGMAVVYRATHRNQAELAIKMLHAELSLREDIRARFLREGYAANSVKHPGAVRILDDDVAEDGAAFLVMELLDGAAADTVLSQHGGRLPLDAVCTLAVELLDVLAAAHAKGIVHRDIKPPNLFVTRDGCLKVLDFGIARVRASMASDAQATGTGVLLGTPAFMAPEHAIGKASDVDAQSDLWAVGATVFTLASGAMVHEAETAPQLFAKLATQPARSLAAVVPGAPAAVVSVIDRALASDKAQRWATAGAMRDALAAARRSAFGEAPSRAVLAALVASPATPSEAPSQRDEPSPANALRRGTVTAGALSQVPAVAVVETSGPVSTDGRAAPKGRAPRGATVALVAFGALASTGALAFVLRHTRSVASPLPNETASAPSAPVESRSAPPPPATATAEAIAPEILAPIATAEAPIDAGHSISPALLLPPLKPKGKDLSHQDLPSHGADAAAPPPVPPSAKPDCNPNYRLDALGEKHFKPECFK